MRSWLHLRRSGRHYRVADPDWENPLDSSFAKASGGCWNAPGTFGVLYLNATVEVARAQVRHRLRGGPIDVEDLDPGPDLVHVEVAPADFVDVVSDAGCQAVGLSPEYPEGATWDDTRPIGMAAFQAGERGIACRSAAYSAPANGEELALFDGGSALQLLSTQPFEDWY